MERSFLVVLISLFISLASWMKLALDQLLFDPFLTTFFFVLMGLMEVYSF
jgi:hypothetical protein